MHETSDPPLPVPATHDADRTRRALLVTVGTAVAAAACAPATPGSGPTTPRVPPTTAPPTTASPTTAPPTVPPTTTPPIVTGSLTASMVVDKLTFGPRPGLVAAVASAGIGPWIDAQLAPVAHGVPDAEARLTSYTTLRNTNRQNYDVQDSSDGSERLERELDHATLLRAVFSERQLYELMVDFWSNHFNTWRNRTWMLFLKTSFHETVIRPHALGKFSDLLLATARHTAMLDYLDNIDSNAFAAGGVNENYARELLELHTLGITDGQQVYSEADIRGVAKVMSGWSINWDDTATRYDFKFLPWLHSRDAVSILGGAYTNPARSYGQGYDDGVRLIGVLARHASTAAYVCRKLVTRFVGDSPSEALVASTAAVFTANDTAIAPTLRHIFMSEEFATSSRSKVRRPFEHAAACLRAVNATVPNDPATQAARNLRWGLDGMGQPLFERHSPDGYPDENAYWLSSEGLLKRWDAAGRLMNNTVTSSGQPGAIVVTLASLLPTPLPPTVGDLVVWVARNLANYEMPPADVTRLCTSCGFTASAAATTVTGSTASVALLFGLVFCHPLFQRR